MAAGSRRPYSYSLPSGRGGSLSEHRSLRLSGLQLAERAQSSVGSERFDLHVVRVHDEGKRVDASRPHLSVQSRVLARSAVETPKKTKPSI